MIEIIVQNAIKSSIDLVNKSQIISEAIDKNEVKIVTAYYNLGNGKVDFDLTHKLVVV